MCLLTRRFSTSNTVYFECQESYSLVALTSLLYEENQSSNLPPYIFFSIVQIYIVFHENLYFRSSFCFQDSHNEETFFLCFLQIALYDSNVLRSNFSRGFFGVITNNPLEIWPIFTLPIHGSKFSILPT